MTPFPKKVNKLAKGVTPYVGGLKGVNIIIISIIIFKFYIIFIEHTIW